MSKEPRTRARSQDATDGRPDDTLPLPHERDESTGQVAPGPDPVVRQAKRDLDEGQVDTDLYGTPGLDAERRKRLVPTPAEAEPSPPPDPKAASEAGAAARSDQELVPRSGLSAAEATAFAIEAERAADA